MKVFVFDPLWHKLVDDKLLGRLAQNNIDFQIFSDRKPLHEIPELFVGKEPRIICLNPDYVEWRFNNDDYSDIPNLKAILAASTGYEWIEQGYANEHDIVICNIKNFSTQAVAEWAVTMMMNLARQTPLLIKDGFPLDYDIDFLKYRGMQVKGKTAGVIGLGHIGSAIAEACRGLGMEIIYWSKNSTNDAYQRVELDDLIRRADVIFPALAKNDETTSLMGNDLVMLLKPGAIVIDIAHDLLDQSVMLEMVADGRLFGYGFEAEPLKFGQYMGNVWAAPSYAWTTYESMYNSEVKLVENIIAAVKGQFPNRVN